MLIRHGLRRQHGVILLSAVILVFVTVTVLFLTYLFNALEGRLDRSADSAVRLHLSEKALIAFVAREGRLPCPADGSLALNDPNRGLEMGCTGGPPGVSYQATGILPWRALALREDQVINAHGDYYSYRVYSGPTGLTRPNGADMTHCDTDNTPTPTNPLAAAVDCENANHNDTSEQFILNKGLTVVRADSTSATDVAFVVIDHGPNRRGALNPSGVTSQATLGSRPEEVANAAGIAAGDYRGTFYSRALSIGIDELAASYVDDVLHYQTISDVARLAGKHARDWQESLLNPGTTTNMTSASTDPFAPSFMSTGGSRAGQAFTPDASGTAISAGGAAASYSTCTWWPSKVNLVTETTRKALISYVDFAAISNAGDNFPGFTMAFLSAASSVSRTGTGSTGGTAITVASSTGISTGMTVLGIGVATGATVTGVAGTTISLSPANTANVSGAITFGAPTNITCGTGIALTVTASGAAAQRKLVVSDTAGISVGMGVFGDGIPFDATVSSIPTPGVGGTVEISVDTTAAVAGVVDFSISGEIIRDIGWAGGTLARPEYNNRFAVEFDATTDIGLVGPPAVASAVDPLRPHLAVDFGGVTHGTDASSCTPTAPGAACDSELSAFPSVTKTAVGSTGGTAITITDATGMYGIVHGMTVIGLGIPGTTVVTAISGNLVTLSQVLTGSVSTATFSSLPTSNFMQNGLSVFHGARTEIYPKDCFAPSAAGTAGASTVTVTDGSQLQSGMAVYGAGIGVGATVSGSFKVNLSSANTSGFSGPVTFTGGGSTLVKIAVGIDGDSYITVANVAGIVAGMTVSGGGVGGGATVSNVQTNLSAANSGAVASTIVFAGATAVSTTGTGASGSTSLVVGSTSGIAAGMTAVGTGLGQGAKVISVNAITAVVVLSVANSSAVSGTIKFLPERTLVKGWTLSNAGCNLQPALCAAMKNTTTKLSYPGSSGVSIRATGASGVANISVVNAAGIALGMAVSGTGIAPGAYVTGIVGNVISLSLANIGRVGEVAGTDDIVRFDNRQMLQTLSCLPAASVGNAYDSLYFGLTTANGTVIAAVSPPGFGTDATNQITVDSAAGIQLGMFVRGTGIANGARVTNISGTTLTLSAANTDTVSGTITFAGEDNVKFGVWFVNAPVLP